MGIECPNTSKYALGMHRLLRWFVGTVASLLGLSLLLVRWGFWATESTVVEDAQGMRAVLVAIQKLSQQCWVWSYCFPPTSRFCTPNNHLQMDELGHGSLGAGTIFRPLNKSDGNSAFH